VNDDDDDDDPYGTTGASSSSLAFAFDNKVEQDDDIVVMGEPSKPTKRPLDTSKRPAASTDTWHDGRPVLQGFVMDPLGVPTDKW
jgi:G patch domain-containing protein 1